MSDDECVICPNCVHEFRAIPVNVQAQLTEANAKLEEADETVLKAVAAKGELEAKLARHRTANSNLITANARLEATIAEKDRVIKAVMEELKGQAQYDCPVTNPCAKRCIDALAALIKEKK